MALELGRTTSRVGCEDGLKGAPAMHRAWQGGEHK